MKKSLAWLALFCIAVFAQEPEPIPVLVPVVEAEPPAAEAAPAEETALEPEPAPTPVIVPPAPAPVAKPAAPKPVPLAQALRNSGLVSGCVEDFVYLLEGSGFSMGKFARDLPPAVAKVKVQMKSPFGKPKSGDMTSVGLSVGCINALPESPAELQGLLKSISLEAGLKFVESAADSYSSIPSGVERESDSGGGTLKTIVCTSLFAGGLGAMIYGFMQDGEVSDSIKKRDGKAAVDAESSRNTSYGIGAALLAGGLGIVVFF
jgi:hypothetical protein